MRDKGGSFFREHIRGSTYRRTWGGFGRERERLANNNTLLVIILVRRAGKGSRSRKRSSQSKGIPRITYDPAWLERTVRAIQYTSISTIGVSSRNLEFDGVCLYLCVTCCILGSVLEMLGFGIQMGSYNTCSTYLIEISFLHSFRSPGNRWSRHNGKQKSLTRYFLYYI